MDSATYQLRVRGMAVPDGTITVRALLGILRSLVACAERSLRLAIEGHSTRPGKLPGWLEKAAELRLTGLEQGSTILDIEAPTLGAVASEQLRQPDFWVRTPEPQDTALTLVSHCIRDATTGGGDSDYVDAGILHALLGFRPFLKGQTATIELRGRDRPADDFALGRDEMQKAEVLEVRTPEPRVFLVSGQLDGIEHSRRRFDLILQDGRRVAGRIDEEFVSAEELRRHWGREVTVKGRFFFRPSGNVQLIEAQHIKATEPGEQVLKGLPPAQPLFSFEREASAMASARSGWLAEVWAKWPGDEPIEDLLGDLKR